MNQNFNSLNFTCYLPELLSNILFPSFLHHSHSLLLMIKNQCFSNSKFWFLPAVVVVQLNTKNVSMILPMIIFSTCFPRIFVIHPLFFSFVTITFDMQTPLISLYQPNCRVLSLLIVFHSFIQPNLPKVILFLSKSMIFDTCIFLLQIVIVHSFSVIG